jgi:hypothetical protein
MSETTTEPQGDTVSLWNRIPQAARIIAVIVVVLSGVGLFAFLATTNSAARCSKLVTAGTAELDAHVIWQQANRERDAAFSASMRGADYVVVTDAEAKSDAASKRFVSAGFHYVNVKHATSGCQSVDAAYQAVKTARDLVDHDSAGAEAKLAAADAEWARIVAAN